ncbi:MAG: hypothetical protein PHS37_10180, partial [Candidatus Omnitrophica bacterium]|nr:hypothetical protein [Candidatus Omnitrophota bacterium]
MRWFLSILVTVSFLATAAAGGTYAADVKQADKAGNWYPGSNAELSAMIGKYLSQTHPQPVAG